MAPMPRPAAVALDADAPKVSVGKQRAQRKPLFLFLRNLRLELFMAVLIPRQHPYFVACLEEMKSEGGT